MSDVLIPRNGTTSDQSLRLLITLSAVVPTGAFVDVLDGGVYLGTAAVVSTSQGLVYEFQHTTASLGSHEYTARIRYAAFLPTPTLSYPIEVIGLVAMPALTLFVQAPVTDGFSISCLQGAGNGEVMIEIGIPASAPSGAYSVRNGAGTPVNLGSNVDLNHVTGTNTYYAIDSRSTGFAANFSNYINQEWSLVQETGATFVMLHAATFPVCVLSQVD